MKNKILKYLETFSPLYRRGGGWGFGIGDPKGWWQTRHLFYAIMQETIYDNYSFLSQFVWRYLS